LSSITFLAQEEASIFGIHSSVSGHVAISTWVIFHLFFHSFSLRNIRSHRLTSLTGFCTVSPANHSALLLYESLRTLHCFMLIRTSPLQSVLSSSSQCHSHHQYLFQICSHAAAMNASGVVFAMNSIFGSAIFQIWTEALLSCATTESHIASIPHWILVDIKWTTSESVRFGSFSMSNVVTSSFFHHSVLSFFHHLYSLMYHKCASKSFCALSITAKSTGISFSSASFSQRLKQLLYFFKESASVLQLHQIWNVQILNQLFGSLFLLQNTNHPSCFAKAIILLIATPDHQSILINRSVPGHCPNMEINNCFDSSKLNSFIFFKTHSTPSTQAILYTSWILAILFSSSSFAFLAFSTKSLSSCKSESGLQPLLMVSWILIFSNLFSSANMASWFSESAILPFLIISILSQS